VLLDLVRAFSLASEPVASDLIERGDPDISHHRHPAIRIEHCGDYIGGIPAESLAAAGAIEQLRHRVGCGLMARPVDIGVEVSSDLDRLMPEVPRDGGDGHAGGQHPRCAAVSEVVRRRFRVQAGLGDGAVPDLWLEQVVAHRASEVILEQPVAREVELVEHVFGDVDGALTALRLRCPNVVALRAVLPGTTDPDGVSLPVDIARLEGRSLTRGSRWRSGTAAVGGSARRKRPPKR
jgi:hypothetical protein